MSRKVESVVVLISLAAALGAHAGPMWGYQSPSNGSVLRPGAATGLSFPNPKWAEGPAAGNIDVMAAP